MKSVALANTLLALSTLLATAFVVLAASLGFGGNGLVRYSLMAVACAAAYVLFNPMMDRWMKRTATLPLISREAPQTAIWAMGIPVLVLLIACIPLFRPGYDYGLAVIVSAVLLGLTLVSALKARKADTSS
ncbi:MAG TPA: hypothetical protein DER67_00100 [Novosphingobium sp.]|nr:hypothetical protein [Novosphingobium sp.]